MNDTPELIIVRRYAASVERVYSAWTDPEKLRSWFVPSDMMKVPIAEADARSGGHYRIRMENAAGETFTVGGIYEELVPNERLVFSWQWESGQTRMRVCVDLKPIDEHNTELTLTHSGFESAEARGKHNEGWAGCLKRLGESFTQHARGRA